MSHAQRILVGCAEPSVTKLLKELLKSRWPDSAFTIAPRLDGLIHHACRTPFDTSIVVLDKLEIPNASREEQIEKVLRTLGRLQIRGAIPVTALAFACYGPDFVARVRDAVADSFLLLPAEPYTVQAAMTAAFDAFVRRQSSGIAPLVRLTERLLAAGYEDIELRLSENRDRIDFRARRQPEQLGRYLKQYDRAYSRMLRTIRAAGFSRVGFEELGLEVEGDQLEGSFLVRPLEEICEESIGSEEGGDGWLR